MIVYKGSNSEKQDYQKLNFFTNTLHYIFRLDDEIIIDTSEIPDLEKDDNSKSFQYFNIEIRSSNFVKLNAIKNLLGKSRTFGKCTVTIKYGYNGENFSNTYWDQAFEGNPIFKRTIEDENGRVFAMFEKEILEIPNENENDPYGISYYILSDAINKVVNDNSIVAASYKDLIKTV